MTWLLQNKVFIQKSDMTVLCTVAKNKSDKKWLYFYHEL